MTPITLTYIKEKWQHAGFQKYLKNTGWMFGGRMFSLIISFFVGAYIARYLGPSNYGLLNYVISFVGLFAFLTSFGIDSIVSREIIKDHGLKDKIIGASFFLKLIGAVFTILVIVVVSLFTAQDNFTLLLIWLFSLSYIPQAFNIIETYFQTQVLSKKVVRAQIIANLISTAFKLLVIFLNKGIFWLLFVYVAEASIVAILLLSSFNSSGQSFRNWRFNKQIALSLLKDSWPLMLSSVAMGIYLKIDQVIIKNMLGNESVGLYAVAVKLSEVWFFIPIMICTSILPALINAKKTSEEFFNVRLSKLYSLMFWLAFIIALPISIFSKQIIYILFGSAYVGAALTLSVYVWCGISFFLGVAVNNFLLSQNLTKISFYTTAFGAIINIVLNIMLIPIWGILGSAIATLFSYTFVTFSIILFKESRPQIRMIFNSIINPLRK
jgi:O-antigen/teichoic acid export membrane protein